MKSVLKTSWVLHTSFTPSPWRIRLAQPIPVLYVFFKLTHQRPGVEKRAVRTWLRDDRVGRPTSEETGAVTRVDEVSAESLTGQG